MSQLQEFIEDTYEFFSPRERREFRHVLTYWCAKDGCVSYRPPHNARQVLLRKVDYVCAVAVGALLCYLVHLV